MTLQKSTGAEKSRKERRVKHARLPAQVPASRVSEKPGGNERQEWKDEVSCQEDRNHEQVISWKVARQSKEEIILNWEKATVRNRTT